LQRIVSTIIERIWNAGYEIWKVTSAFWDEELGIGVAGSGFGCEVSLRGLAESVDGVSLECGIGDVPKPFLL